MLCLQSLQIDFFDLKPLKEELINNELATCQNPNSILFAEPSYDIDGKEINSWLLSEKGEDICKHLKLNLPVGSIQFIDKLISDYKINQQRIFKHEAEIKKELRGYSLQLKTYKKDRVFFKLLINHNDEELIKRIAFCWEKQNNDPSYTFFIDLMNFNIEKLTSEISEENKK